MKNTFPLWLVLSIIICLALILLVFNLLFSQSTLSIWISEAAFLCSLTSLLFSVFLRGEVKISASHKYSIDELILCVSVNNQTNSRFEMKSIEVKGYLPIEEEDDTKIDNKLLVEKDSIQLFAHKMIKQNGVVAPVMEHLDIKIIYNLSNTPRNKSIDIVSKRR